MTTAIVVEPPATPNPCSDEPSGRPDGRHHPLAAVLGQQAFAPLTVELTRRREGRPGQGELAEVRKLQRMWWPQRDTHVGKLRCVHAPGEAVA